jgi:mono/diheme cytochrome c family protein
MTGRLVLAALAVVVFAGDAAADGDFERGADIARQWCVECHATEITDSGTDQAPAWRSIALDPAKDEATLKAFLRDPHPAMKNIPLTDRDMDDVIAYIRALAFE